MSRIENIMDENAICGIKMSGRVPTAASELLHTDEIKRPKLMPTQAVKQEIPIKAIKSKLYLSCPISKTQ